jgi:hypothetical protein
MDPMNIKQKFVVIIMDVLLLVELGISIYLGYRNPENLTIVFLKTYVPALIVTVVAARVMLRYFRDQAA